MSSIRRSLTRLGKKGMRYGKFIGKQVSRPDFLPKAQKKLAGFNKFALPVLAAASLLPHVGGAAGNAAKVLSTAQTGLTVANQVKNIRDALTTSMGRSVGNEKSVESFHTPNLGAIRAADKEKHILSALSKAADFDPNDISVDSIMGMAKSHLGGRIRDRIQKK